MPVEAVVGHIRGGTGEEANLALHEVEGAYLVPRLEPGEVTSYLRPESVRVLNGALVHLHVLVDLFDDLDRLLGGSCVIEVDEGLAVHLTTEHREVLPNPPRVQWAAFFGLLSQFTSLLNSSSIPHLLLQGRGEGVKTLSSFNLLIDF